MVIAALITAVASAPIGVGVAYLNHQEALVRMENERTHRADELALARERLFVERRQASCAGALGYLQDERPNATLPPPEAQVLLADMRRLASDCAISSVPDVSPPVARGARK